MQHSYKSLKENILKEIEKNHISPHSRGYFLLKSIVLIFTCILLALITVYVISLILFTLGRSGMLLLSPFGFYGVFSVINDLPWLLVFIAVGTLFGTLFLAKESFRAYRLPLIYLFLFSIGFVGVTGLLVAKTKMHPVLIHRFSDEKYANGRPKLPKYFRPEGHDIQFGTFIATSTDGTFEVTLREGDAVHVRVNDMTKIFTAEGLEKDSKILIFGERRGSVIFAKAIREIEGHDIPEDLDEDGGAVEGSSLLK